MKRDSVLGCRFEVGFIQDIGGGQAVCDVSWVQEYLVAEVFGAVYPCPGPPRTLTSRGCHPAIVAGPRVAPGGPMSNRSIRRAIPILLILLGPTLLPPTLATARPLHTEQTARPVVERADAGPGLLAQFRDLLSFFWAENGSGLDPDGAGTANSGTTGDNGSGLEPNGSR